MRFWICLLVACAAVSSARAAPPLEAYGRLPAIDAVSISASGEMIALTYWQDGEHRLLGRSALGPAVLEAPLQFPRMRGLQWAGDEMTPVSPPTRSPQVAR